MAETWNDTVIKVEGMINADESGKIEESLKIVAVHMLDMGNTNEGLQVQMTKSLREALRGQVGYPWRKGGGGILSATALSVVDTLMSEAASSFATAFDECGTGLRAVLTPHGKSKKNSYANGADYGNFIARTIKKNATTLVREGTWDGTLDGLINSILEDDEEE